MIVNVVLYTLMIVVTSFLSLIVCVDGLEMILYLNGRLLWYDLFRPYGPTEQLQFLAQLGIVGTGLLGFVKSPKSFRKIWIGVILLGSFLFLEDYFNWRKWDYWWSTKHLSFGILIALACYLGVILLSKIRQSLLLYTGLALYGVAGFLHVLPGREVVGEKLGGFFIPSHLAFQRLYVDFVDLVIEETFELVSVGILLSGVIKLCLFAWHTSYPVSQVEERKESL